jgi:hypothetical protein
VRGRTQVRWWPSVAGGEATHGVQPFLAHLVEMLGLVRAGQWSAQTSLAATATRHGAELLEAGASLAQVVHEYGDICRTITELAIERHAEITVLEYQVLNRCLDTAIAAAVTEHARLTAEVTLADS